MHVLRELQCSLAHQHGGRSHRPIAHPLAGMHDTGGVEQQRQSKGDA
jgi:hypothetical protein